MIFTNAFVQSITLTQNYGFANSEIDEIVNSVEHSDWVKTYKLKKIFDRVHLEELYNTFLLGFVMSFSAFYIVGYGSVWLFLPICAISFLAAYKIRMKIFTLEFAQNFADKYMDLRVTEDKVKALAINFVLGLSNSGPFSRLYPEYSEGVTDALDIECDRFVAKNIKEEGFGSIDQIVFPEVCLKQKVHDLITSLSPSNWGFIEELYASEKDSIRRRQAYWQKDFRI